MLDEKDLRILGELQRDCRQGIGKIALKMGLPRSTVYDRIRKLEREGVIERYVALLSDEKLGVEIVGFILIKGRTTRYLDKMSRFYTDPHVAEIRGITGEYDLLIKTRFRSMKEFSQFLIDFREEMSEDISETKTLISTTKLKETTHRPIR